MAAFSLGFFSTSSGFPRGASKSGNAVDYFVGCTVRERPPASGEISIPMFSPSLVSQREKHLRAHLSIKHATLGA
eukprot:11768951-Heterocapsa_arctica.AAC.1